MDQDHRQRSLAAVLTAQATAAPGQPWAETASGDRVVRRDELARIAARWDALGLAGRRVALVSADPVAFGALFVALVAAGATVVPLDSNAPQDSIDRLVDAAGADVAVTVGDTPRVPVSRLLTADPESLLPPAPDGSETVQGEASHTEAGRTPEDGGVLLFSSGSTGPRKAVRLGADQLLHVARAVARSYRLTSRDRGFNPLPLAHVNGEVVGLLAPLVSGGTVVLAAGFHRTGFWDHMRERAVTWVNAVPAIVTILSQEPPGPAAPDGLRFVRSASAPLPAAVLDRFEARYGVPVIESYGMTEAASQITANPVDAHRPGTVGVPVGVELRVVAENGEEADVDEVGHVHIRGAGVIRSYDTGIGADRFDADGWLDTGDLGTLDPDGYLTLVGRAGDVINRSGEKILPSEVEDVLMAHPFVREAVVFGRPEPVLGQVPVAYVVPAEDAPNDLTQQLTDRCTSALPRAHRPVEIRIVEELAHGPTGKPVRRLVAESDQEAQALEVVRR